MEEQETVERAPEQSEPPPPPATARTGRPRSRRLAVLLILLFVALAAFLIWRFFFAKRGAPENVITLSGRIEGDDSALAPKTTGRILEIRFREGDHVKAGEVIAILSQDQLRSRVEQARAVLREAEAKARSARDQIAVLQEQLRQQQLQKEQARIDAQGRVRQAEAELAAARADLAQQEANYQLALFDLEAFTRLAKTGAVSERQAKQAISTAAQQAAAVTAARRRVAAAQGALTTAEANLTNPAIRGVEAAAVQKQITQQQAEVASATASIEQARAQLREARENRQDLIVTAPFSGTITTRSAEPGEVVTSGTALVTLLDLSKVYLRGFIPEKEIGRVKAGQPARVFLDSNPNQPIEAYVSRIDPEATFTPENIYFRDERVKQVFGLKLQLKGAVGFAKPGMPADGEILVQGDKWPEGGRRK